MLEIQFYHCGFLGAYVDVRKSATERKGLHPQCSWGSTLLTPHRESLTLSYGLTASSVLHKSPSPASPPSSFSTPDSQVQRQEEARHSAVEDEEAKGNQQTSLYTVNPRPLCPSYTG